jgi:hypothetical protein
LLQVQRIQLVRETDDAARVALLLRIGALEVEAGRAEQAYQAYAEAFASVRSRLRRARRWSRWLIAWGSGGSW